MKYSAPYTKGPASTRRLRRGGFTLIELLASVAIFSIVMVMALGALLALSVADRKAETLKSAIDNLTFAADSMSRAIRTGSGYHCDTGDATPYTTPHDCPSGGNFLAFTPAGSATQWYYQIDTTTGACGQSDAIGCIERSVDGGNNWSPITSPDILVQNTGFLFYVLGAAQGDGIQPKVSITMNGLVLVGSGTTTPFHLQTTVTQRIYDQ